jgi:D-alanine-D-alanine ligase
MRQFILNNNNTAPKNGPRPRASASSVPPWRIALIANTKENFQHQPGDPSDAGSEFDRKETVEAIAAALESDGHRVHICEADYTLPEAISNLRPQICFNIAEGLYGDGREAQTPALLELLRIPYTGSRIVANAISLDKSQTKRIWHHMGLPTAAFVECLSKDQLPIIDFSGLEFPLMVKPGREGSGMGIDRGSLVWDQAALLERVAWALEAYHQPVLVEEYLPGREFTVGFIGNPSHSRERISPVSYDLEGYHWFPVLEIDTHHSVSPGVYGHDAKDLALEAGGAPAYLCPADIPDSLRVQMVELAKQAAQALGTCDVGRVDIRLDSKGEPHLLEINTLPGLNPSLSDLCIMAAAEGMEYPTLIKEILYLAAERFGLQTQPSLFPAEQFSIAVNGRSPVNYIASGETQSTVTE